MHLISPHTTCEHFQFCHIQGEVATAAAIDRSAPLEMPTQVTFKVNFCSASHLLKNSKQKCMLHVYDNIEKVKRGAEDSAESAPKRMRDDTVAHQKIKVSSRFLL